MQIPTQPPVVVLDLFCGGGGTSSGAVEAMRRLGYGTLGQDWRLIAINHDALAVASHRRNHPDAEHHEDDVENLNPREILQGQKLKLLVASPPCTHFSNARGGKPKEEQMRATPNYIFSWVDEGQPDVILIENVPEIRTWGPLDENGIPIPERKGENYREFLAALRSRGYYIGEDDENGTGGPRILNAADYGDPQMRRRWFLLAVRMDMTQPDPLADAVRRHVWPQQTHSKNGAVPNTQRWRGAFELLDLDEPSKSIFTRPRPLSPKTRARIARGFRAKGPFWEPIAKAVEENSGPVPLATLLANAAPEDVSPFLRVGHIVGAGGPARQGEPRDISVPLPTLTTDPHLALAQTSLSGYFHIPMDGPGNNGETNNPRPLDQPLASIRASRGGGHLAGALLVSIDRPETNRSLAKDVAEPLPTITGAPRVSVVAPLLTHTTIPSTIGDPFLVPQFGERPGQQPRFHDTRDPLPAVTSHGAGAVVASMITTYNGNGQNRDITEPLSTLTTVERHALSEAKTGFVSVREMPDGTYEFFDTVVDVTLRMLTPRELARGMSFPDDYEFVGNRGQVVKQIGNAVPVMLATHLIMAAMGADTSQLHNTAARGEIAAAWQRV